MATHSIRERLGPLGKPDANSVCLPEGFTSRIVARTGEPPVATNHYKWHAAPDGGATFAVNDGGWIYVSNSEMPEGKGGVGALRFAADGTLVDAYAILQGTNRNCAGGLTPWRTWLSCEEIEYGSVIECDPFGKEPSLPHAALGYFRHEAAAVDLARGRVYLTEDQPDGRLYRFTSAGVIGDRLNLDAGALEVARVFGKAQGHVVWYPVPDSAAVNKPTRQQVPVSTAFDGGEGLWIYNGKVYFTTKGDNRVWFYDPATQLMKVVYDDDLFWQADLKGVDNITVSQSGILLVAEDGGDMQIVAIDPNCTAEPLDPNSVVPVMQIVGHKLSEVTGPAFDPSGNRLYFSSQRGESGIAETSIGVTYEITGPFNEKGF